MISILKVEKKKTINRYCCNKNLKSLKVRLANLGIADGINNPRLSTEEENRENPKIKSTIIYYFRITLFIYFLNSSLYDLESRFDEYFMSDNGLDVVQ